MLKYPDVGNQPLVGSYLSYLFQRHLIYDMPIYDMHFIQQILDTVRIRTLLKGLHTLGSSPLALFVQ